MAIGDGIRRNVAHISKEERDRLRDAFRKLDDQNDPSVKYADGVTFWDKQEAVHKAAHAGGQDVHGGPAFLAWHRELCNRLEAQIRQVDPELSLHYWDWTTDPRASPDGKGGFVNLMSHDFMGNDGGEHLNQVGGQGGDVGAPFQDFETTEGGGHQFIWRDVAPGAPVVASDDNIRVSGDGAAQEQQFTLFDQALQGAHNYIHSSYIRGTIGDAHFSFHDPFVFLLHSNTDRLWAMWQRAQPWRLDPSKIYGDAGKSPTSSVNTTLGPWDGSEGLFPWNPAGGQSQAKTARDPSIIMPPSYDTVPHTSFIVTDRDTFSSYEVEATANYPKAFYVIYDGFAPQELGSPIAPPNIALLFDGPQGPAVPGMNATYRQVDYEDPARAPDLPQRITFTFDLHFTDSSAFNTFTETRTLFVKATHGVDLALAPMHLIKQPNPYMMDGAVTWLSTDLRVFQMRPGQVRASVQQDNPDTNGDAPYQFIQALLARFNSTPTDEFHPFHDISTDQQASALELSRTVNGQRVLNYAVAKVRYRANTVAATDVKVFFRAFDTMVSALDYNINSNYRRSGAGDTAIPLLGRIGDEIASIPFFAGRRVDTAGQPMTSQTDDTNRHTINAMAGQESVAYFGCWLDFNQTDPQFPLHPAGDGPFGNRLAISQLVRGHHLCLVAEIYFQPGGTDPIPPGATPASSDRLAQRNLAVVESDNPGNAATHTVQHTLRVRPSRAVNARLVEGGTAVARRGGYDELVFHWNDLPRDTKCTLYFPEWNMDDVLRLAALRQRPDIFEKIDAHTLRCTIADISYLPVVGGAEKDYAGLISLELPRGITEGNLFTVDVQQYSGFTQRVTGSFQIVIPVRRGEQLLPREIRKLAALRYIAEAIPAVDRWHPVFVRYLSQIENKIKGLGGDPGSIKSSLDDPEHMPAKVECITGKVCEVVYDCFGEFEGFVLATCEGRRNFSTKECGIEAVVRRACHERTTISVCCYPRESQRICHLILRCGD
ncbi:hypothetical protein EGT07_22925 [Herbaspirillum sp. HC18]|nr:hypothetical protein EGT07_22925 [Herbaspirillum sp. HC18]